jgi:hypothetical protein
MDNKKCKICEEIKPLIDFSVAKQNKDGFNNTCKKCKCKYAKLHRINNRDKINNRKKELYKKPSKPENYTNIEDKNWIQVAHSVKAMLFLFETSFIVADFECRFIDSGIRDIRDRLYTLACDCSKDLLLKFSGEQFQMYGNLSSKALCHNDYFNYLVRNLVVSFCEAKKRSYEYIKKWSAHFVEQNKVKYNKLGITTATSILGEFVERMTKGIAHKNSAIIPTVQATEEELLTVEGHRILTVIDNYNKPILEAECPEPKTEVTCLSPKSNVEYNIKWRSSD